jgi:N-acylneuraminate cytidylyltransferase
MFKPLKKKIIALIPARSGSKRIPDKNIKVLNGHPLIAYSIRAAIDSAIFDDVVCVTDSEKYASIARYYGAEVPSLRPKKISGDKSPDIDWVKWILLFFEKQNRNYDLFSILRPTSPFRLPSTIQAALNLFNKDFQADSLRAVDRCIQHPGKMWVVRNNRLLPILPFMNEAVPWHSCQYAALPEVFIQNASLEIAWSHIALQRNSIAGESIIPFFSSGLEGFDINNEEDMLLAYNYLSSGKAVLPTIRQPPYLFV